MEHLTDVLPIWCRKVDSRELIGKDGAIARNQAVRDCTITKVARSYVEVTYELPNAGFVKTKIEAATCGTMVHYDSRDLSF
jgi:hypothetical protein